MPRPLKPIKTGKPGRPRLPRLSRNGGRADGLPRGGGAHWPATKARKEEAANHPMTTDILLF